MRSPESRDASGCVRSSRPREADASGRSRSERSEPVGAADDVQHDLVRAGADAIEPKVAPRPLDAVLLHVAGPAVDLEALVRDLACHARGVELGHRDLPHGVLAVLEAPGRRVDHLPPGLDLRRHVAELVADGLELADRAPEGAALGRVLEGAVEELLGAGDASG